MAEWLYEAGIGEARAALIDRGEIVEALIEPDDGGLRPGTVVDARLVRKTDASGRGRVALAGDGEADLENVPPALTEGARLRVEIVRAAIAERGAIKPPRARPAPDRALCDGPDLRARLVAGGTPVRTIGHDDDPFERHGWSELFEEAASGIVARPDALLRISLTPALTLIDVDGAGAAPALAVAGARRAGEAIRRLGLAGSIGIDLPTMPRREDRQAAAAALDAALPPPFERTAVNGFGFLQIVRRRTAMSLPERIAHDPVGCAARALLRRAERARGSGAVTLAAPLAVIAAIEARRDWLDALARRVGAVARLRAERGLPISGGHAQRDHP